MFYWLATARYDDGTEIERRFPYDDAGKYTREEDLEEWLITRHDGCNYYSVCCVEE